MKIENNANEEATDQQTISSGLNIGEAIAAAKEGKKIGKANWLPDCWFSYCDGNQNLPASSFWSPKTQRFSIPVSGGFAKISSCLVMMAPNGECTIGWTPSTTELLSEDWYVQE